MDSTPIYLSPPDVGDLEKTALIGAIESGWVAPTGPSLVAFEVALSEISNRDFAVGLSSGTSALHLGLLALGVKAGDYVVCSTLTFVATANAIRYVGAHPIFVDSDVATGNLSAELLEQALVHAERLGRKVGAVVPVDFLGSLAAYEDIVPICDRFGVPVLADAAESLGAKRNEMPAGSQGVAGIFSFNGNKIATTSGGGALVTDDEQVATQTRFLANQAREDVWHYEHTQLGFNYRLSNLLAAIGTAQLQRLPEMLAHRKRIRALYRDVFTGISGIRILGDDDDADNCWLTAVIIEEDVMGFSSRDLAESLRMRNIESRALWKPMHLQPLYKDELCFSDGSAEHLFSCGLALPSGSGMSASEWERVHESLESFLNH